MNRLLRRLDYLTSRRRRERELAEEVDFHRSLAEPGAMGNVTLARSVEASISRSACFTIRCGFASAAAAATGAASAAAAAAGVDLGGSGNEMGGGHAEVIGRRWVEVAWRSMVTLLLRRAGPSAAFAFALA